MQKRGCSIKRIAQRSKALTAKMLKKKKAVWSLTSVVRQMRLFKGSGAVLVVAWTGIPLYGCVYRDKEPAVTCAILRCPLQERCRSLKLNHQSTRQRKHASQVRSTETSLRRRPKQWLVIQFNYSFYSFYF